MRRVFALLLASCCLNVMDSILQAEEPKPQLKSIVFLNRASSYCERGELSTSPGGRPSVLIYPDMTIEYDSQGNYSVSFAVESPRTDVTLNLELVVPFSSTAEKPIANSAKIVEGNAPPTHSEDPKKIYYEAQVVVPPILIPSNKGDKVSDTRQYNGKQVWVRGNSVGLALAYPTSQMTTYVPISGKAAGALPRRSGRTTLGTIVK
ncbi:MAG: hypothetical protein U0941_31115 [Planctomycetaceae bacterium]